MHEKDKKSSKNFVHEKHKSIVAWKDLIAAAESRLLRHQVEGEEMKAALRLFKRKAETGEPFPGIEALGYAVPELDGRRANG